MTAPKLPGHDISVILESWPADHPPTLTFLNFVNFCQPSRPLAQYQVLSTFLEAAGAGGKALKKTHRLQLAPPACE
jgi:hypothetical protein